MRAPALGLVSLILLAACAPEAAAPPAAPAAATTAPSSVAASASAPAKATATPDEPFRATKPPPLPNEPAFTPPVPVVRALSNGAKVLVVENHALPLVSVDVVIQSGVDREPLGRRGLCRFVSEMLLEGTRTRSSLQLEIARERLAAHLSASSGWETTTVHLNALKDTLPEALALLADVLENPAFKAEDVERARGVHLTALAAKKGDPGALAGDSFAAALWGPKSPLGLPSGGTPATVKAITVQDLVRYHQTYFVPNNAIVSVAGDVTPDEIAADLEKVLGTWKRGTVPPRPPVALPDAAARSIVVTDLPTGTQSQVLVGWRGPKADAPELVPLLVANNIVGGLFSSRLNMNLREDKAYSYGVFSFFDMVRESATFTVTGGIVAEHTADAVREIEKELARLKTDPIGDEELARAKEALVRELPSQLETNDAVAATMASLVALGRPLDYYAKLPERIRAVQKADVVAAVQKSFDPARWPVIVVGPKAQSFEALKGLGMGEVREARP